MERLRFKDVKPGDKKKIPIGLLVESESYDGFNMLLETNTIYDDTEAIEESIISLVSYSKKQINKYIEKEAVKVFENLYLQQDFEDEYHDVWQDAIYVHQFNFHNIYASPASWGFGMSYKDLIRLEKQDLYALLDFILKRALFEFDIGVDSYEDIYSENEKTLALINDFYKNSNNEIDSISEFKNKKLGSLIKDFNKILGKDVFSGDKYFYIHEDGSQPEQIWDNVSMIEDNISYSGVMETFTFSEYGELLDIRDKIDKAWRKLCNFIKVGYHENDLINIL